MLYTTINRTIDIVEDIQFIWKLNDWADFINRTLKTEEDTKFISKLNHWEDYIVALYLLLTCCLAVILNFLVIYTFIRNRKSMTFSDYHILNLACSDALLPLSGFPLSISSSFSHQWIFGESGCVVYGFIGFFFGLVSIMTLTVMGVTRYISICHPAIDITSYRFTRNAVGFPYLFALMWSTIPLSGWGSYSVESYGTSCTLQWNENKIYITLVALCCIATPSAIMVFSYGFILAKCRASSNNIQVQCRRNGISTMSRKEGYLIKITFAMWWGFLLSWVPYAVVSMWSAYGDVRILPTRVTVVAVLLAKSSTVVNPITYFILNKKFCPMILRSLHIKKAARSTFNTGCTNVKITQHIELTHHRLWSASSSSNPSFNSSSMLKSVLKTELSDE